MILADYNFDGKHTGVIRQNYTFLLEHLSPIDTGLMAVLFDKNVVDQAEIDDVNCGEGCVRQCERLLSVLCRKSSDQFDQFLVALDQTGQEYVAGVLRGKSSDQCQQPVVALDQTDHEYVAGVSHQELFVHSPGN